MSKVSVIVPIYNKEKCLSRCINSLINQTFNDIEIILINDGSIDKSKDICNEYSEKDRRVKVIHKDNGGVSSARNFGLKIALGRYITFVDPDDYLDNDAIETLYELIIKYDSDIACYRMRVYKNEEINNNLLEDINIKLYKGKEIIRNQVLFGKFLHSSCNKLYSRNLFDGINDKFNEDIKYAEDALFNICIMSKAKKLVDSNVQKYNYFINKESTVNNINIKRLDILKAQRIMVDFLNIEYGEYVEEIKKQYIKSSILLVSDMSNIKDISNKKDILACLRNQVIKDKKVWYGVKNINIKTKLQFNIIRINPILLLYAYRVRFKLLKIINNK